MDVLRKLQAWYRSQCDGDWEHEFGIKLETLDNPGWSLTIDLEGTPLEGEPYEECREDRTELNWVRCWVKDRRFKAACGPENLDDVLSEFLGWAERCT